MDEHRIGLKPIRRRIWARKGQRPIARVQHRYQWLYLYAFVQPATGHTFWLLLPTVNARVFSLALREFARDVQRGSGKQIVLVLDQAGWHVSGDLHVPAGLHLVWLPPYSPELQPAEHLWPLTNEPLVNRPFRDLDELMEVQAERCRTLDTMPALIRAQTCFHWWPKLR